MSYLRIMYSHCIVTGNQCACCLGQEAMTVVSYWDAAWMHHVRKVAHKHRMEGARLQLGDILFVLAGCQRKLPYLLLQQLESHKCVVC